MQEKNSRQLMMSMQKSACLYILEGDGVNVLEYFTYLLNEWSVKCMNENNQIN